MKTVTKTDDDADLEFRYDGMGKRIMKIEKPKVSTVVVDEEEWIYTIYIRDASGNVMAIYERVYNETEEEPVLTLAEQPIYGSSRVGMYRFATEMENKRILGTRTMNSRTIWAT